ncbi:MAG: PIN domain-containing protein [Gemmataceae bacterium]
MTTAVDPIFVDTNVLIYARSAGSPFHAPAVARLHTLETAGVPLWIGRQMLREYLAGLTRPGATAPPIPLPDLVSDVRAFQQRFRIAEDGAAVTQHLEALLLAVPCGGRQVYDANIVATMLAYEIPNLLTHNVADFTRFASSITVVPLV